MLKELSHMSSDLSTGITPEQMRDFKKKTKDGDILKGRLGQNIKVIKKYKNFVKTDDGTYVWIDLYMHNERGLTSTADGYEYKFRFKEG